jgi:hypothetical protein
MHEGIDLRDTTDVRISSTQKLRKSIQGMVNDPEMRSCLLFGGWTAHTIAFEIEKQKDGKCTFRIYNRGAGIEYHRSVVTDFVKKSAPCIAIKNISENVMMHSSVLGMLQALVSMSDKDSPSPIPHTAYRRGSYSYVGRESRTSSR